MTQGAIWVADWPVTAAELAGVVLPGRPAAVEGSRGILAANAWARERGIREGMGRRAAHVACPEATILPRDRQREANRFEPVLRAIDAHIAHVTILEPGCVVFAARGAVRTGGSAKALAEAVVGEIAEVAGCEARIGIGEGTLAALAAARSDLLLSPEESVDFLRSQPLRTVLLAVGCRSREKTRRCLGLLERLGVRNLEDVVALGASALTTRFGDVGRFVWELASGRDVQLTSESIPVASLTCGRNFDPPIERIQEALFRARSMADELGAAMGKNHLSGGNLTVGAHLVSGRELSRTWVVGDAARDIVDRIRWQLTSWIDGPEGPEEGEGLVRIELCLREAICAGERAQPLWGGIDVDAHRAVRAAARMQALLGEGSVRTPREAGGRGVRERHVQIPWGEVEPDASRAGFAWPGAIPDPGPVIVHPEALRVELVGDCGHSLRVTGDGALTCTHNCMSPKPASIGFTKRSGDETVIDYAGPWPIEERWWDHARHRRRAYLQIACPDSVSLVYCEQGIWHEEARYG